MHDLSSSQTLCSRVRVHVFACSRICVYGVFSSFSGVLVFRLCLRAAREIRERGWPFLLDSVCFDTFLVFSLCLAVCLATILDSLGPMPALTFQLQLQLGRNLPEQSVRLCTRYSLIAIDDRQKTCNMDRIL